MAPVGELGYGSYVNKNERHAYVMRRARELARSGEHIGWRTIKIELCFVEGYNDAQIWLDDLELRTELDALCAHFQSPSIADPNRWIKELS